MYFPFLNLNRLNFNRYQVTRIAFSVFLVVSILNWAFMPSVFVYAEGEEAAPAEVVVTETPPAETVVDTGTAVSQTGVENGVNTNEISASTDLTVQNTNEAEVANLSTTTAETGGNNANGGEATTTITTGDAVANTDVVNTVNTNVIDSSSNIMVGSGSLGDSSLDLRDSLSGGGGGGCSSCLSNISITDQNIATVTNDVIVRAETGGNSASSTATTTVITGDAYAGANVVNIINTNIVKSNYVLLVFNNFGNWNGDLIFPIGDFFEDFFSGFSSGCNTCGGNVDISNNNNADVSSSINNSANSGDNNASGGDASINTGNSLASSNVFNQINTNVYGGSSFYLRIRIFGDWSGSIFNLPKNIVWGRDSGDIILYNQDNGNPFESGQSVSGNNNLSIQNTNTADVMNNVNVSASTGNNNAVGGNASVQTGNAYAGTNLVNIVNTNIVSANWTAALVNIFGNWRGNISFGQPDLWIGTIAESSGTLAPGTLVKFITTIKNNGDATASGIKVMINPSSRYLSIVEDSEWFLSPLLPGESKEVSYYGTIAGDLPGGHTSIANHTSVSLNETDKNTKDNTDTITLLAYSEGSLILPYTSRSTSYPDLEVVKSHTIPSSIGIGKTEMVPFGGSADYKIIVKNHGGSAFEGVLFDQLKNASGEIISEQSWDLEEIKPNEEITLTYTVEFNTADSIPGTYTNYAWVEALGGDSSYNLALASEIKSNVASDKVIVAEKQTVSKVEQEKPIGKVLGLFDENVSIINEKGQPIEFLNGFCAEEKSKEIPLGVPQSLVLGLSFVLIMKRRKNIPHNLFLV